MSVKKIIREELGEWDWAKDVTPTLVEELEYLLEDSEYSVTERSVPTIGGFPVVDIMVNIASLTRDRDTELIIRTTENLTPTVSDVADKLWDQKTTLERRAENQGDNAHSGHYLRRLNILNDLLVLLSRDSINESEDPWKWVNDNPDYVDISNVEVGDTIRIEVIGEPGDGSYGVNPHIFDNQVGEVTEKSYSDTTDEVFIHVSNWESQDWGDIYFGNSDARMGTQYRYHVLDRKNINESEGFKDSTEEDWEWTSDVPAGELGDFFESDDIIYDEADDDYKVNLFSDHVIYNLKMDDFKDHIGDHDDWCLDTLLRHEGRYQGGEDGDMDSEEIDYIGWHLTQEQQDRLQNILNDPRVVKAIKVSLEGFNPNQKELFSIHTDWQKKRDREGLQNLTRKYNSKVSLLIDDQQFGVVGPALNLIHRGRNDWDEFSTDALWAMGTAIDANRWITMNNSYNSHLEERGIEIEYNGYNYGNGDKLTITVPFPFRDEYNLSDILPSLELDVGWSDWFYDDYDVGGSVEEIQSYFESLLEKMEEALEDEDFE